MAWQSYEAFAAWVLHQSALDGAGSGGPSDGDIQQLTLDLQQGAADVHALLGAAGVNILESCGANVVVETSERPTLCATSLFDQLLWLHAPIIEVVVAHTNDGISNGI